MDREEPQRELRRQLQRIYHGHGIMDSPGLMDDCSCASKMRGLLDTLATGDLPGEDVPLTFRRQHAATLDG